MSQLAQIRAERAQRYYEDKKKREEEQKKKEVQQRIQSETSRIEEDALLLQGKFMPHLEWESCIFLAAALPRMQRHIREKSPMFQPCVNWPEDPHRRAPHILRVYDEEQNFYIAHDVRDILSREVNGDRRTALGTLGNGKSLERYSDAWWRWKRRLSSMDPHRAVRGTTRVFHIPARSVLAMDDDDANRFRPPNIDDRMHSEFIGPRLSHPMDGGGVSTVEGIYQDEVMRLAAFGADTIALPQEVYIDMQEATQQDRGKQPYLAVRVKRLHAKGHEGQYYASATVLVLPSSSSYAGDPKRNVAVLSPGLFWRLGLDRVAAADPDGGYPIIEVQAVELPSAPPLPKRTCILETWSGEDDQIAELCPDEYRQRITNALSSHHFIQEGQIICMYEHPSFTPTCFVVKELRGVDGRMHSALNIFGKEIAVEICRKPEEEMARRTNMDALREAMLWRDEQVKPLQPHIVSTSPSGTKRRRTNSMSPDLVDVDVVDNNNNNNNSDEENVDAMMDD